MERGFTLVELLISVAIFSIIVTIVFGIFVSASKTQRMNLDINELLSQSNYLMEYMSRAVRMAKKDLTGDCTSFPGSNYGKITSPGPGIAFMNYEEHCQEIFLDEDTGRIMESKDESSSLPLTSDKFKVTSFNIVEWEESWDQEDLRQPRITFLLEIKTKDKSYPEFKMQIQTSISQRNLDIRK
jgi:prepilin-type N-terminal cleavage/methylation domain-containing protein